MTTVEIENIFNYHAPNGNQPEKYEKIRAKMKECALLIDELCPHSQEKDTTIIYLRGACMWANASIACNE